MKKRVLLVILIVVAVAIGLSATTNIALANSHYPSYEDGLKIIPDECLHPTTDGKICDLTSFVQLFINLAQVMLKILPYIAMIMMIWAGFNLMTSGGNPEKIQGGKKMVISIILGVLITTILAWTWSFFVITLLTCDLGNKEKTCEGKIFPGYIFGKEWWGGGNPVESLPPEAGCCVINDVGCTEVTKEECSDFTGFFQGGLSFCSQIKQCETFAKGGCCADENDGNDICYNANEEGCIGAKEKTFNANDCGAIKNEPRFNCVIINDI
ncbi:hypothetical protein IID19_02000 [Patescibacteria group bacterium]|nr:hypothetical protein [Patescibacteria group bacterium]